MRRYLPVSPVVFQVGDIVELQVSLVSFPATKNTTKRIGIPDNESSSNAVEYTVKLILRSVLLLDGSMTSVRNDTIHYLPSDRTETEKGCI